MLPAFTALFSTGLLLGSYLPYFPLLTTVLLIGLALLPAAAARVPVRYLQGGIGVYAALLAGLLYWHVFGWVAPAAPIHEQESPARSYIGTIVEPAQHAQDRVTMVLALDPVTLAPTAVAGAGRVRLVWREPSRSYCRGDRVEFRGILRAPHGAMNPRAFDYAEYLRRQGIGAIVTVSGPDAVRLVESGTDSLRWWLWHRVDEWRDGIRAAATTNLNQPALGVFLSLIIGERGYLAQEVRDWFMATGTVHILSISGSHLGLVALVTYGLFRRCLVSLPWAWLLALSRRTTPTRLAALVTIIPVSSYAVLAGAETATIRSLLMVATALLAIWLGYRRHLLHALSFAALVILLDDPRALFDISFQLSFVSAGAIAWLVDQTNLDGNPETPSSWFEKGARWGKESLWISIWVSLATLPLVAFYFNQIAWIGLAANMLVVPFTGFLLVPIGLGAAFWHIATGGDSLPAAAIIDLLTTCAIEGVRLIARVPAVEVFVAAPTVPMMGLFYWLGYLLITRPRNGPVWAAAAFGLSLIVGWWIWSPRPFHPTGDLLRVTFLDVGQGDSAVVEFPDGKIALIDGGAAYERFDMGRNVVAPYLWNRGIRSIDHVVASHPQLDHVGGLPSIIDRFAVGHVWSNGLSRDEGFWRRLETSIKNKGLSMEIAHDGLSLWSTDRCHMNVVSPERTMVHRYVERAVLHATRLNDSSIVIDIACGGQSLLFTADLERQGLASLLSRYDSDHVTILKVPHHGARSSFDPHWLASIRPEVAVFSVGAHNPYRHPARDVVEAYVSAQAAVFRTDRDGAVWVDLDVATSAFRVHRTADWMLQPVALSLSNPFREFENISRLWRKWNWL
jgi:competence protein ComEC